MAIITFLRSKLNNVLSDNSKKAVEKYSHSTKFHDQKLLSVAIRNKVPIRYGCSSCRCGTCAVKLLKGKLSEPKQDEIELLQKLAIYQKDNSVRLSCRARVCGKDCLIDLDFQKSYDPSKLDQHSQDVKYEYSRKIS